MLDKKKALGLRIKELREHKKFTQDKLAEMVGIDPKHLSRIENGRNYPSLETLEKIVKYLNVDFNEIFNSQHLEDIDIIIEQINKNLSKLSNEKIRFIYKIIKELLKTYYFKLNSIFPNATVSINKGIISRPKSEYSGQT